MDSDLILILKMRQGSDDAWDRFVHKYYGSILKYCFYHCQDPATAEDLTQETFLKFFAALPRYQHRGRAKSYLYTIAANLCKDQARPRPELSLEETPDLGQDPSPELEDRLALLEAIRKLPEELEDVIVLHYYQGLTLSEIGAARSLGLPLVKYRLKRAKELLRKELCHESG